MKSPYLPLPRAVGFACTLLAVPLTLPAPCPAQGDTVTSAVAKQVSRSVFMVRRTGGAATGFFLDGKHFVTAMHLLPGMSSVEIVPSGGASIVLRTVVALDTGRDFALLSLPKEQLPREVVRTGSSSKISEGEALTVVFAAERGQPTVVKATVAPVGGTEGVDTFRLRASLPARAEGAPVLNAKDEVVGMVTGASSDGEWRAVRIEAILAARGNGVPLAAIGIAPRADAVFLRVNGMPFTYGEYVRALQRQNVTVQGATAPVAAVRLVLDQIVSQAILLEEAKRAGVLPSDTQVNNYYRVQKMLYEQQFPGKDYEKTLAEQGTTPTDSRTEIRWQLSETALYATRLKITEADVRAVYDSQKAQVGLPERVSLRLIVVAPDSPDFEAVKKALEAGTPFDQVARQYNAQQLKAAAGLLPQPSPVATLNPNLAAPVKSTAVGGVFGPVDFQQRADGPKLKAWGRVENKLLPVSLSYDDGWLLVLRAMVQQRIALPENAALRNEIMRRKLEAVFESTDPVYQAIWQSIRQSALDAGIVRTP
jgi:parvulin-like peptidyl-prolyl isomerase